MHTIHTLVVVCIICTLHSMHTTKYSSSTTLVATMHNSMFLVDLIELIQQCGIRY